MERYRFFAIVAFWLAAMSWLVLTKVFPVVALGPAPTPALAATAGLDEACWEILREDQSVGFASSHVVVDDDGGVSIRSMVRLHQLPVGTLLNDLVGGGLSLTGWTPSVSERLELSASIHTQMTLVQGTLESFVSRVAMDDVGPLFRIEGDRQAGGLEVRVVSAGQGEGGARPLFTSRLPLPEGALVLDAFSPYSQLRNLRVGKRWQMRSFRAFPPNRPIRLIEAQVDRRELFVWEGEIVTCFVVRLVPGEGTELTTAAAPLGWIWVDDHGMVLKQSVQLMGVELDFARKPVAFCRNKLTDGTAP